MLATLPILAATASLLSFAQGCSVVSGVEITFYGAPDNDPPGDATAYNCGRDYHAGGTGAYDDPLTFATAPGEYDQCEVVYFPFLRKYLRMEDSCAQCTDDWAGAKKHIDIWTGPSTISDGQAQIDCEDGLTPDDTQAVIRSPATNLPVNTAALWDGSTCHTEDEYPTYATTAYCTRTAVTGVASATRACQTGCSWSGHCIGCPCTTYDDCSDDYICTDGYCAKP